MRRHTEVLGLIIMKSTRPTGIIYFLLIAWAAFSDFSLGQGNNAQCNSSDTNLQNCTLPQSSHVTALKRCVRRGGMQTNWTNSYFACTITEGEIIYVSRLMQDALSDYINVYGAGVTDYWIGLNDFDNDGQFEWASDGKRFDQSDYNRFDKPEDLDLSAQTGKCVAVSTLNHTWFFDDCSAKKDFICSWRSALMPRRPSLIPVGSNVDITREKLQEGSQLTFRCNAILSSLGDMRFYIFSDDYRKHISMSDMRVYYDEGYKKITDPVSSSTTCFRYAEAEINLTVAAYLDGKRVACVTYTESAMRQCSKQDLYCNASSVLSVDIVPHPGLKDLFDPRVLVILALIGTAFLVSFIVLGKLFSEKTPERKATKMPSLFPAPEDDKITVTAASKDPVDDKDRQPRVSRHSASGSPADAADHYENRASAEAEQKRKSGSIKSGKSGASNA